MTTIDVPYTDGNERPAHCDVPDRRKNSRSEETAANAKPSMVGQLTLNPVAVRGANADTQAGERERAAGKTI